jgi:hypothetical protein
MADDLASLKPERLDRPILANDDEERSDIDCVHLDAKKNALRSFTWEQWRNIFSILAPPLTMMLAFVPDNIGITMSTSGLFLGAHSSAGAFVLTLYINTISFNAIWLGSILSHRMLITWLWHELAERGIVIQVHQLRWRRTVIGIYCCVSCVVCGVAYCLVSGGAGVNVSITLAIQAYSMYHGYDSMLSINIPVNVALARVHNAGASMILCSEELVAVAALQLLNETEAPKEVTVDDIAAKIREIHPQRNTWMDVSVKVESAKRRSFQWMDVVMRRQYDRINGQQWYGASYGPLEVRWTAILFMHQLSADAKQCKIVSCRPQCCRRQRMGEGVNKLTEALRHFTCLSAYAYVIPYVFGNISSIALLGGLLHWAATGIHRTEEKG